MCVRPMHFMNRDCSHGMCLRDCMGRYRGADLLLDEHNYFLTGRFCSNVERVDVCALQQGCSSAQTPFFAYFDGPN